ncbi:MAG: hypothetical protein A3K19_02595 [Lentisphaerae bacterium RIFOXYB12_FULL_65_16]|nr:MAG: hypothetical protein A3K18_20750 [Lentisphaerae bacterium RIFOXYA12_64_32]OGV92969.1 MAG: hypothetical protein A3K19_02595 [Lentisphaerae bacterium RIFOXYB12_FULL_65_16]
MALAAWCAGAAEAEFRAWHFLKPVDTARVSREDLAAVKLDPEVYLHSRADLADIRLRQGDGPELPFVLEKQQRQRTRFTDEVIPTEVAGLKELEGNRIEITVRVTRQTLSATAIPLPVSAIRVETPLRDYEKQVAVFGSRDGVHWAPVVQGQTIFDYSRYMDVRGNRVEMPDTDLPMYRVVLDNVTDLQSSVFVELTRQVRGGEPVSDEARGVISRRDFRIDRLVFLGRRTSEGEVTDIEADYPVSGFKVQANAAKKWTEVAVTTAREPLCGFTLATTSRNFSRAVRVQALRPTDGVVETWADVGAGTIEVLAFRSVNRSELTVRFPETRAREYRLLIQDGDSPPLDLTGVTGLGNVYRVLFLASPGTACGLYFGNDRAQAPVYDAAQVLGRLQRQSGIDPVELAAGPMQENPGYGRITGLSGLLENRLTLGVAMALVLGVLAWAILRAVKRIETMDDTGATPPDQPS